jgi:hypothetical protein
LSLLLGEAVPGAWALSTDGMAAAATEARPAERRNSRRETGGFMGGYER